MRIRSFLMARLKRANRGKFTIMRLIEYYVNFLYAGKYFLERWKSFLGAANAAWPRTSLDLVPARRASRRERFTCE
jgi:hypothetical protein